MTVIYASRRARMVLLSLALLGCGDSEDDGKTSGDPGATSSGAGGSGGDGGGGGGPAAIDPRVEACLRINACDADGGTPVGLHACLGHALDERWAWATVGPRRLGLAAMQCKLAATDCAGVRACTPAAGGFAAACSEKAGSDLCEGDTWVFCDDLGAPIAAMDCAAVGLSCMSDFVAGCGAEPCDYATTPSACDPEDKDVLIECSAAGFLTRVHCPSQYNLVRVNGREGDEVFAIAGETCGHDEQRGALGCVGTGEACGFFSQRCDGAVLETCAGGKLGRRDCAAEQPEGQGCGFIQSGQLAGAASCGFVGGACDLGGDEACDGAVLRFCDGGTPAAIDCRAAGYTGCAAAEQGGRTVAYCTP
ncbi:hypothetical protein WME76_20580 [Sorangium sp. So ce119]|uniref:hypothetical protein n=1 Tax=Sorangium sp. So ce119 TaxID=3133279 RepID=UPI003F638606